MVKHIEREAIIPGVDVTVPFCFFDGLLVHAKEVVFYALASPS